MYSPTEEDGGGQRQAKRGRWQASERGLGRHKALREGLTGDESTGQKGEHA